MYEGDWEADAMQGTGTFTFESGARYTGEWRANKCVYNLYPCIFPAQRAHAHAMQLGSGDTWHACLYSLVYQSCCAHNLAGMRARAPTPGRMASATRCAWQ